MFVVIELCCVVLRNLLWLDRWWLILLCCEYLRWNWVIDFIISLWLKCCWYLFGVVVLIFSNNRLVVVKVVGIDLRFLVMGWFVKLVLVKMR